MTDIECQLPVPYMIVNQELHLHGDQKSTQNQQHYGRPWALIRSIDRSIDHVVRSSTRRKSRWPVPQKKHVLVLELGIKWFVASTACCTAPPMLRTLMDGGQPIHVFLHLMILFVVDI